MINITNEDNMDLMARYPDKYFDLGIIDPEYGIGASKQSKKPNKALQKNGSILNVKTKSYTQKDWDNKPASKEFFDELFRVTKHQIIWGVNYFDYKFGPGRIVWNKPNGDSDQYGREIAFNSLNNRTDIVNLLWAGMMQGTYCGTDIRKAIIQQGNKQLNEKRIHPTQKPIPLCKYLLHKYAQPGWKILDTNTGSANLAIACHDLNFSLTGCELDTEYYDLSLKRLAAHQAQTTLF